MLPVNPSKLPHMFREANQLMAKGKTGEAQRLLETIIATDPKVAQVHFQLGKIHLQSGRADKAADAFGTAAALKPGEPAIWQGYVEAALRMGDADRQRKVFAALDRSPLSSRVKEEIKARLGVGRARTKVNTGGVAPQDLQHVVALLNNRKPDEAERVLRSLLRKHPKVAILHTMLGSALRDQRDMEGALSAFEKATELDPNYAEAQMHLGRALVAARRIDEGLIALETARRLTPQNAEVLLRLSQAYLEKGRLDPARDAIEQALRIEPDMAEAYFTRARVADKTHDPLRVIKDTGRAMSLGLKSGQVLLLRATALDATGDVEGAIATVDEAINLMPENGDALGAKATFLQNAGDFEAAEAAFADAFERAPLNGTNFRIYSAAHKFTEDDPLIDRMRDLHARDDLGPRDKMQICFALSKAMEDVKAYDQVFPWLDEGAALMRASFPYDIKTRRIEVDTMKSAFENFDPNGHPLTNDSAYAPIFVTGMPRSGTTLVEQILASHSTVTGAGEVGRFSREAQRVVIMPEGPRHIDTVRQKEIAELARDYEAHIRGLHPDAKRITDKSIQTYFVMGLVWLSMPQARIVVVRRDPCDNLLSVYKNVFPEGTHLYSYDLRDLGAYYRMFVEMVDFWRGIAPDRFHEVWYEDLIDDPEGQSRALVSACDLKWEDACLNFHQNKRRVDTLSVYQVRQPIYKTSLKAWQRYEKELAPLFESLGDLAEPKR